MTTCYEISPDIALLTPAIDYPGAITIVLFPLHTFREKAALVHVQCNKGRLPGSP